MRSSPNRVVALVAGAAYLVIGFLGFTATAGVGFFAPTGGLLLGFFEVNGLQNVVHVLIGAALMTAGLSRATAASAVNSTTGALLLVLGLAGLFLVGSGGNIFAINVADNVLHFGSAAVLLAVGLGAEKRSPAAGA